MDPLDFLRRLAALANRSNLRARLPSPPPRPLPEGVELPASRVDPQPDPAQPAPARRTSLSWAQLLYRVFFIDALLCAKCGGRMTVIAFLSDPVVVRRVLEHLKIPATPPPIWPPRSDDPVSPRSLHDEVTDELWTDADTPRATNRGRAPP